MNLKVRSEKSEKNKKHKTQPSLSFDLGCCRSLAHYKCAPKAQTALNAESSLKHIKETMFIPKHWTRKLGSW